MPFIKHVSLTNRKPGFFPDYVAVDAAVVACGPTRGTDIKCFGYNAAEGVNVRGGEMGRGERKHGEPDEITGPLNPFIIPSDVNFRGAPARKISKGGILKLDGPNLGKEAPTP